MGVNISVINEIQLIKVVHNLFFMYFIHQWSIWSVLIMFILVHTCENDAKKKMASFLNKLCCQWSKFNDPWTQYMYLCEANKIYYKVDIVGNLGREIFHMYPPIPCLSMIFNTKVLTRFARGFCWTHFLYLL
jgi:hypothetical protein